MFPQVVYGKKLSLSLKKLLVLVYRGFFIKLTMKFSIVVLKYPSSYNMIYIADR